MSILAFLTREPVRAIGIAAAVVTAVVQTLLGQGVISEAIAGKAIDLTNAIVQVGTILAPIIAAELSRPRVTPVADPVLPANTDVTTPEGDVASVEVAGDFGQDTVGQ